MAGSYNITSLVAEVKSVGIDAATKSLDEFTKAAVVAASANEKLGASVAPLKPTQEDQIKRIEKMLEVMQKQTDLLGANVSETNAYNLSLKDATEVEIQRGMSLGAQVDAFKALGAAQKEAQKDARQLALEEAKLNDAHGKAITEDKARSWEKLGLAQKEAIKINNDILAAEKRVADKTAENLLIQQRRDIETRNGVLEGEKWLANLKRQADAVGLSGQALRDYTAEQMRAEAAMRGVSSQADPLIKKWQETEKSANGAHVGTAGISRELIVLGHEMLQGNFSRFGGSMMVLAERIDVTAGASKGLMKVWEGFAPLLSALINPFTVVAGAAAAIAVAYFKGTSEQNAFNNSLVLTGNFAGTTGSQLNELARVAVKTGGSLSEAKHAALELANSGKFTSTQIGMITEAAVKLEHATGKSVESTVKEFETLATMAITTSKASFDVVSKHALTMNDHYHFLTASQFAQISMLEKLGDAQGAASLAEESYASALKGRAEEIEKNLGTIQTAWRHVKEAASGAWDAMLGIGKKVDPRDNVERIKNMLTTMESRPGWMSGKGQGGSFGASYEESRLRIVNELVAEVTKLNSADAAAIQIGKDQQSQQAGAHAIAGTMAKERQISKKTNLQWELDDELKRNEIAKKALAITISTGDANSASDAMKQMSMYSEAAIEERRKGIIDKYGEKSKKVAGIGLTGINSEMKTLETQSQEIKVGYDLQLKLLENLNKNKLISDNDYRNSRELTLQNQLTSVKDYFDKEVEAEQKFRKEKAKTPAEKNMSVSAEQELTKKKNKELALLQMNIFMVDLAEEESQKKYIDGLQKTEQATLHTIQKQTEAIQMKVDAYNSLPEAVKRAGITEKQIQDEVSGAYVKNKQKELDALRANLVLTEEEKNRRTANVEAEMKAYSALEAVQKQKETQDKFNIEAMKESTKIQDVIANGFKNAEDALVNFAKTGKLNFRSLADSIITDMLRIQIKGMLGNGTAGGGGLGGMLMSAFAGSFGATNMSASMLGGNASGAGALLSSMNGFADGGDPPVGKVSMVGERGPELFVPKQAGTIIPNHVLTGRGSGPANASTSDAPQQTQSNFTIVNQTTGRIDSVKEQRLSDNERALIISEAVNATAQSLYDGNSGMSKGIRNTHNVQRIR